MQATSQWISSLGNDFQAYAASLPHIVTGKVLLRWPKSRFKEICGGKEFHGNELFAALHAKVCSSMAGFGLVVHLLHLRDKLYAWQAKEVEAALNRERKKQREAIAARVDC